MGGAGVTPLPFLQSRSRRSILKVVSIIANPQVPFAQGSSANAQVAAEGSAERKSSPGNWDYANGQLRLLALRA